MSKKLQVNQFVYFLDNSLNMKKRTSKVRKYGKIIALSKTEAMILQKPGQSLVVDIENVIG